MHVIFITLDNQMIFISISFVTFSLEFPSCNQIVDFLC